VRWFSNRKVTLLGCCDLTWIVTQEVSLFPCINTARSPSLTFLYSSPPHILRFSSRIIYTPLSSNSGISSNHTTVSHFPISQPISSLPLQSRLNLLQPLNPQLSNLQNRILMLTPNRLNLPIPPLRLLLNPHRLSLRAHNSRPALKDPFIHIRTSLQRIISRSNC